MSVLSPAFLLAAALLCAATSSPIPAIAHDGNSNTVLHMTSSLLTYATSPSVLPLAVSTASTFQQLKSGRNLLNLERQQQNAKGNKDINDKDSSVVVGSSSSVVEDWSLVCKQLCGANLGGKPCDAECVTSSNLDASINAPKVRNASQYRIAAAAKNARPSFEQSRAAICVDLCGEGLGGTICDCSIIDQSIIEALGNHTQMTAKDFDIVCNSFCVNAGRTLKGCSACQRDKSFETDSTSQDVTSFAATTETTTTPNWDELCASLCKTGDGGSLCNCDLSPFFK